MGVTVAVAGDTVLAIGLGGALDAGVLVALDAASGAPQWSRSIGCFSPFGIATSVVDNTVVITPCPKTQAISVATGKRIWSIVGTEPTPFVFVPMVITDGFVLAPAPDGRYNVVDLDLGSLLHTVGRPPTRGLRAGEEPVALPAAADHGLVYLGSGDRHLYAYRASNLRKGCPDGC